HDINYIALTGALHAIGTAGGPPVPPVNLLGDFAGGGLFMVCGVLAALHERQGSGFGQTVDAAIVDGTTSLLGMVRGMSDAGQWSGDRGRNLLDGGAPFYAVYACADGRHVAVGALEERFYAALLHGLGLDPADLPDRDDPANWPALQARFTARFAERTRDAWADHFDGTEACVTPVLTLDEAADHPHLRTRGTAPCFDRTPSGAGRAIPEAAVRP
ncbi:MAG: alpha-methylacyl-CoA racemase, partial [Streptomyces sp.]|nr:alpha-methylacyl-CoA racemase [Streptomyces sp.]